MNMATAVAPLRSESANCLLRLETHPKEQTSYHYENVNGQDVCVIRLPYLDAWMEGKTFMPWIGRKGKQARGTKPSGIELVLVDDSNAKGKQN